MKSNLMLGWFEGWVSSDNHSGIVLFL